MLFVGLFFSAGTIHLLLTITGTAVQEVDRDAPLSTKLSWQSPNATDMKELMKKYVSYRRVVMTSGDRSTYHHRYCHSR